MPGMKRDCGGAAAILGAFRLAISSGFKQNLHAVFCLAENSVGPLATRPDDIHTLYSGRTVEINNTDAEGRLVLADGVVYAQKDLKADIILDMATLTGAQVWDDYFHFLFDVISMVSLLKQSVATGKHHAAILTNNDAWEDALVTAGLASGDLTFPLPFCPEFHFSEFASAVADMKNSVAVSFFCINFRADFSIRRILFFFLLGSKQCHFVLRWVIHPFAPRIRFPRDLDAC